MPAPTAFLRLQSSFVSLDGSTFTIRFVFFLGGIILSPSGVFPEPARERVRRGNAGHRTGSVEMLSVDANSQNAFRVFAKERKVLKLLIFVEPVIIKIESGVGM
jgi:hypothetical protein